MKTINGKNKQERVKNKLKKYFNIDIRQRSNKYSEIVKVEGVFWTTKDNIKRVSTKFGDKLIIECVNFDKPIWINEWAIFQLDNGGIAFKPWKKEDIEICKRVVVGQDDLFEVKVGDWVDSKNAFNIN